MVTKEQLRDIGIMRDLKAGRTVYFTKPGGFLEKHYVDAQGYATSEMIAPVFDNAAANFLRKLTRDEKNGSKARRFVPQA